MVGMLKKLKLHGHEIRSNYVDFPKNNDHRKKDI